MTPRTPLSSPLAFGIVLLLIPLIGQLFFVRPLQTRRAALSASIAASSEQQRLNREIADLLDRRKKDDTTKETLPSGILNQQEPLDVINHLEGLGGQAGLTIQLEIDQDAKAKPGQLQEVPLTLRGDGPLEAILAFARALDRDPMILQFDEILLNAPSGSADPSTMPPLHFIFHGITYWK